MIKHISKQFRVQKMMIILNTINSGFTSDSDLNKLPWFFLTHRKLSAETIENFSHFSSISQGKFGVVD
jgi:hypothetical protein